MTASSAGPYGWRHTVARKAALAALRPGQPCDLCGYGMFRDPRYGWMAALELDHIIPRAMGGTDGPTRLVHAYCNRKAGGRLGGRLGGLRKRTRKAGEEPFQSRW